MKTSSFGLSLGLFIVSALTAIAIPTPVSTWSADGTPTDAIGGNTLTLSNGATYTTGKWAQAFSLDGNDDVITAPNSATLNRPSVTNAFTICMWVKWSGNTSRWGALPLFRKSCGSNNNAYNLDMDNSGHFGINVTDSGGHNSPITSTATVSAGVWHHLAGTYDGHTGKVYLDGVLVGSATPNLSITSSSGALYIGRDEYAGCWFGGQIDQIELYDQALTINEVQARRDFNLPPTANAGGDQIVYVGTGTSAPVTLNGGASVDPEGHALTYTWTGDFGTVTGVSPTVTLGMGIHMITLTVTDEYTQSSSSTIHVAVVQGTDAAGYTNLQSLVTSLTAQAQADATTITNLTNDKQTLQSQLTNANAQITTLSAQNADLQAQLTTANAQIASLNAQITQLTQKNANLSALLQSLLSAFDQIQSAANTINTVSQEKKDAINAALNAN